MRSASRDSRADYPVEYEDIIMGIALGYASDDSLNNLKSSRLPLEEILIIKK